MVMAAGLGTRLRPLTHEIPKPLVPVANRPIMEHILELLARQGFTEVVANLHWFGDTIRDRFGDGSSLSVDLTYSEEAELLGTAGGVRNVRAFFGDDPFVVMAADALTDIDLEGLARTHERNGWIATLAVKEVTDTSEYGVVVTGSDDRVQGFQEKPDPAEALSNLANCMIYVLEPEIFDHFPDQKEVDFALDVFPALLDGDIPFGVHVADAYWNDVGSLPEYLQGNLDVLTGAIDVSPAGTMLDDDDGGGLAAGVEVEGPVLLGDGAEVGEGAQLEGPLVIGQGARIGAGARLRESVLLPGTEVSAGGLLAGAIAGSAPALAGSESAAIRVKPS
jgi:mannose-1-phosphate guanylyltransferase/mannose-1-phosphate guanylyltransferase/phosphomannomutase